MNIFNNLFKRSLYTLFSGLFLVTGLHVAKLPTTNSVNRPADTIAYTTTAEPKAPISTITSDHSAIATTYQTSTPHPAYATQSSSASAPQGSYITLAGRTIPIFTSYNTLTDSGSSVGLYNGKFLYGHNSANVLGILPSLPEGTPVSITLNGQTSTYTIAKRLLSIEKSTVQQYMVAISNARLDGIQYAYSLMTCAGTSYGNGDASHRTIVFLK